MINNPITYKRGNQIEWIATLRGIAAILVFISHLSLNMTYETKFVIGRIGVTAFFLISGFLSASSRKRMSGKDYMLNRFVRIYPVYWILVLLMCLVMSKKKLTIWRIMANFTCFQEFLGEKNILGASWMLPIEIVFFFLIAIVGVDRFFGKKSNNIYVCILIICGSLAIVLGVLRHTTGKPFPTAFFLLLEVAFLGLFSKVVIEGQFCKQNFIWLLSYFELTLFISVLLSYENMFFYYVGAYNVGIILTWLVYKYNIDWKPFKSLGSIGFTFFLGADIPYAIIGKWINFGSAIYERIVECVLKFILAILFSCVITKYIEKPLQNKMRLIIKKNTINIIGKRQ